MSGRISPRWSSSFLAAFFALSLYAQPVASSAGRHRAVSPPDAIQQLYKVLSSVSASEEKVLFRGLTPTVKAALWSYHLTLFIQEHPDLSNEQRALITEAKSVVSDLHFFEITAASPDWAGKQTRLQTLQATATTLFTPLLLRSAFLKLGNAASAEVNINDRAAVSAEVLRPQTSYPCECHSATWDCSGWNSSCVRADGDICFARIGCGFFHEDACDGMCV